MEQTTTGFITVDEKPEITPKASSRNLDIEDVFEECGGFGRFQMALSFVVILYTISNSLCYMAMVYIAAEVPFTCFPTKFNNSLIPENITTEEFLQKLNSNNDQCSVIDLQLNDSYYDIPSINSTKTHNCEKRHFDTRQLSTIVSEYDLVCERRWLRKTAFTSLFIGCIAGSLGFGILADRFGRHHLFFIGQLICVIANMAKVHSPYFIMFNIMYFFEGLGQSGSYFCSYSLMIEMLAQKHRMPMNFILHCFFSIGSMILAGVAYSIRQWRHLQYAIALPNLIFLLLWNWLPESPRWLLSKKRYEKAEHCFKRIARMNNRDVNAMLKILREDVIGKEGRTELNGKTEILPENNGENPSVKSKRPCTVFDLIIKPRRAIISFNIWMCWFVNSMLYYGVTINSVDMAGGPYLNFFLMSFIEIPACVLCIFCFHWFGHRKPICFFMVFGGINCISSNFVPKGSFWYPLILAILGKFGTTASFNGIYFLSAEIFPTIIRISSMGTASTFARLGAVSAPLILGLSSYASWLPLSVMGVLGIVFGFLTLFLPEVKDASLPQTIEDMDKL